MWDRGARKWAFCSWRKSEESSLGRGTETDADGGLPTFFSVWTRVGEGKEEKAISYHNTLLIANCDADRGEGGRECVISILN